MQQNSPKKPWENAQIASNPTANIGSNIHNAPTNPEVPIRPSRPGMISNGSAYNSGYGTGGYGSYGGYASGPYSSFGNGYGNNYNGSFGMNRMYGGYGGGYGSFGGYNRFGMNRPMALEGTSMSQRMELSTQSTFQMLDQIVQTFGGFSQMLESTFFATHSSFMAMLGVADQFSQLRNYFSQIFSIMAIVQGAKRILYRITGRVDTKEISSEAFSEYIKPSSPKPSKKPLFVFLSLVFGLPWLFSKLMQHLEKNKPLQLASPSNMKNLEFCKALYEFKSDQPGDLSFQVGELIAILSKVDSLTNQPSDWWTGRNQHGAIGIFPQNYVQVIPRIEESSN